MLKNLKTYYIFVSLPFVALLIGSMIFIDAIMSTITTNPHPQINYTIFVIIICGGLLVIVNARRLMPDANAMIAFFRAVHAKTDSSTLQEMANRFTGDLACILQMVAASGNRAVSHQEQVAFEHELANVHSRINRRNALPNYLTGLLVGMGLLGTFIGLLATLGDITALISSFADLDMMNADPIVVFANMIEKMKAPMSSMAIAFSASMFGLLGSIILGLMVIGIRRLQGDITTTLSSEIARHIEMALSYESIHFGGGEASTGGAGDLTAKILICIEERLAEAARIRQRALSTEIDDFQKQRVYMLRALAQQTEANNNFQSELQRFGSHLGTLFKGMEKGNEEICRKISELTGDKIGSQLEAISNVMEKGNDEISAQISELRVHIAADEKESQRLLSITSSNVRSDLQQLGSMADEAKETNKLLKASYSLLKQKFTE